MKIIHFVHNYFGFSGASKQAVGIAQGIKERDKEIEQQFFTLSASREITNADGFVIHTSKKKLIPRCLQFISLIKKFKPNVVHFHGADFALLVLCKVFNVKVYWKSTLFGSDDFISLTSGKMGHVKKELLKYIDVNNTLTKQIYLSNIKLLECAKLVTIPNGVMISENNIKKDKVAIIVSAIIPRKSIYEGIDFFNKNLRKHGYRLFIIGPRSETLDGFDASYYDHCLGIANSDVYFMGELPQLNVFDYLNKAQYLIHLSKQEGMPNVVLEAMSFGAYPIVTSMDGLSNELIENGVSGFNVDGGIDFDVSLFKGENLFGREFIINNNSFSVVAGKTIDVYRKLVEN